MVFNVLSLLGKAVVLALFHREDQETARAKITYDFSCWYQSLYAQVFIWLCLSICPNEQSPCAEVHCHCSSAGGCHHAKPAGQPATLQKDPCRSEGLIAFLKTRMCPADHGSFKSLPSKTTAGSGSAHRSI